MPTTRLSAYGGPGRRYGSFAAKQSGGVKPAGIVTKLGAYGGPRQEYGSFAGKSAGEEIEKGVVTRLGAYGGPRPRIGSFANKATVTDISAGGGYSWDYPRRRLTKAREQKEPELYKSLLIADLLREDEEMLTAIMAFIGDRQ